MASCNSFQYLIVDLVMDEGLYPYAVIKAHWSFFMKKCLMMAESSLLKALHYKVVYGCTMNDIYWFDNTTGNIFLEK